MASPGVWVVLQGWVDEQLVVAVAAGFGTKLRVQGIDGAADSDGALLFDLVGHGVGQAADWFGAGDSVAVVVEQAVEVAEAGLTMPAQDGEGG